MVQINKEAAVRAKVAECVAKIEAKYGVKLPHFDVLFNLRGKSAGIAARRGLKYYVRLNYQHMQMGGKTWEHLLNDTVPHEVAHIACFAFPQLGNNHNDGWKRVCLAAGGNGKARYSADQAPEAVLKTYPFTYVSTTGHFIPVSRVIHGKIQRGTGYTYRGGKGRIDKTCRVVQTTKEIIAKAL